MGVEATFVMCIEESSLIALTLHKVYRVVPDKGAIDQGWIRIVDNTGAACLYPLRKFVPVQIPAAAVGSFQA